MYILATINGRGYIYPAGSREMIHKQSRNIHTWKGITCLQNIVQAKEALLRYPYEGVCFALSLTKEGGGESIWVFPEDEKVLNNRLRIWSGCYGAWKVHFFNAPVRPPEPV